MRVLVVEVGKSPYVKDIEDSYKSFQSIVGGDIDTLFSGNHYFVFHGEGKRDHALLNKKIDDTFIFGTFFVCTFADGEFIDLSEESISFFKEEFDYFVDNNLEDEFYDDSLEDEFYDDWELTFM